MIEVMQFILSSFWTWLGTVILIAATGGAAVSIVEAFRGKK